jgi:hypothetical protein
VFVDFLRERFGERCDWDHPPGCLLPAATAAAE